MRIVYCTDLHGDKGQYEQLVSTAVSEDADAVVIGGDLLPHEQPFEQSITEQREFIRAYLGPLVSEFKSRHKGKEAYLMMGNYDWAVNMDLVEEMERRGDVRLLHQRVHELEDGFFIAGYGCVPPTPFRIKDWERLDGAGEEASSPRAGSFLSTPEGMKRVDMGEWLKDKRTIEEDLDDLSEGSDPRKTVYVMHSPPYGTSLDRLFDGTPVGSKAIRRFIEKTQPCLTLHGHIHESPEVTGEFMDRIGRTVCVNPGRSGDDLRAVSFDLSDAARTLRPVRTHSAT